MTRPLLAVAAAGTFAGLVLAYTAFAWVETERRVLDAAEAEGRAVLDAVAAGVRTSVEASAAVDEVLARRLFDLGAQLDATLADEPDDLDEPLRRFVAASGLRGAIVLDARLEVRAAASARAQRAGAGDAALDAARLERTEAMGIAADARRRGLGEGEDRVRLGFGEPPFSTRPEYAVAMRAPRLRGFVVLRESAEDLEAIQRSAGLAKLLRDAAAGPGIAYLVVQGADGRVLAADDAARVGASLPPASSRPAWRDEAGARVLDVAVPGVAGETLRVGLAAGPVEELVAQGRRDVVVAAASLLAAGAAAGVLLALRAKRIAAAEERERFASLGRLAAGVAHEVRSPLNALSMAAQRLVREAQPSADPERARFLELTAALRGGIARLDGTVREFLALGAAGPPPERAPLDLDALVAEVVAAEGGAARVARPDAPVRAIGDRALLAKALANLVRNAQQIAPGTVEVRWRRADGRAVIEVVDGGPGVAVEDRERVFEPFFTKRAGGTGLGLAIARDAIERQGGRIALSAAEGGGARFAIDLPEDVS